MNNGTTIRELSSVGSERLPYKQRVGGSTPSAPTKKDLFRIPEEVFFYVYVPPECYGKSWGKSKTDQALNLRSCFELFEMFFEVKKSSFSSRFFSQIAPLSSLEEAVETEVFHSQPFKQTIQNSFLMLDKGVRQICSTKLSDTKISIKS